MSEHAQAFVTHLKTLAERDRGALAALRRSLGFTPGTYAPAFPYVERFAGLDQPSSDAYRQALYVTAGLFALQSNHIERTSFAAAYGALMRVRDSGSIERRFIALLAADPENLPDYLRQAVSLLAADGLAFDYVRLLDDLARWLNPYAFEQRDALRQRWARDFYQAQIRHEAADVGTEPAILNPIA